MILWLAVIAGSKSSEFTASAIEPIESFGKSIGGTVTKLPQYIPIPLGGDQKMSYAGLSSAGSAFQSTFTSGAGTQGSKFGAALGDSVADVMGVETDKTVRDIRAKISASGGLK